MLGVLSTLEIALPGNESDERERGPDSLQRDRPPPRRHQAASAALPRRDSAPEAPVAIAERIPVARTL